MTPTPRRPGPPSSAGRWSSHPSTLRGSGRRSSTTRRARRSSPASSSPRTRTSAARRTPGPDGRFPVLRPAGLPRSVGGPLAWTSAVERSQSAGQSPHGQAATCFAIESGHQSLHSGPLGGRDVVACGRQWGADRWHPRLATADDADEVAQLLHDFNSEFGTPSPGGEVLAARLRVLLAGDATIAIIAGTPAVGVALVAVRPNVWYPRQVALLDELYVVPHRRGRGIGSAIIDQLMSTSP